jgi:hypothetical protein
MTAVAPRALADLRVSTLAREDHLRCMRHVCRAIDVRDEDWSSGSEPDPPHLVLIESSGMRSSTADSLAKEMVERALELVAWADSHDVPTVFWETSPKHRIDAPLPLMRKVKHLFVADPDAVAPLMEQLGGRLPVPLPLAAQVIPDSPPTFDKRQHQVVFLGRWPATFSGRVRRQLEAILDVARDRDLVIFQPERDIDVDELPSRYSSFVEPVRSAEEAIRSFRNSRVVIGFDPRNDARRLVPQVTFDALAAGTAVVVPNHEGIRKTFRYSSVVAKDREEAEAGIERLLDDRGEWDDLSTLARRSIMHAHTYAHRLATVASAARFRLLPEQTPKPA